MPEWQKIDRMITEWEERTRELREQLDIIKLYDAAPSPRTHADLASTADRIKLLLDGVIQQLKPDA